jgi:LmbE family N-acetylglucosaminyl deacetylase
MATLVIFHAHPDDECIGTGGVMRKAADEGHRVVLVVATNGERGEIPDGLLKEGETLAQRRIAETHESARVLGVARTEFLGYHDSGMAGDEVNDEPGNFWVADVDEAEKRLAEILREESADVLTVYDDNGAYGHPDHIQVHRVGTRAAELAGTPRVYQSTINRDNMVRAMETFAEQAKEAGIELPDPSDNEGFGKPESVITGRVDVREFAPQKRAAMRAHASQIAEQSFFLAMPDDAFAVVFGTEWFIRDGQGPGITETDLLQGL